jgi:hypothetical protein
MGFARIAGRAAWAAAGLAVTPLVEYAWHRWVAHGRRPDPSREGHLEHHRTARDVVAPWTEIGENTPRLAGVFGGLDVVLGAAIGLSRSLPLTAGRLESVDVALPLASPRHGRGGEDDARERYGGSDQFLKNRNGFDSTIRALIRLSASAGFDRVETRAIKSSSRPRARIGWMSRGVGSANASHKNPRSSHPASTPRVVEGALVSYPAKHAR